jgi:peptidoglycan/LPS O-acetylase OafA/YrhL
MKAVSSCQGGTSIPQDPPAPPKGGVESIEGSKALPRLTCVDALRGAAALLVVMLHAGRDNGLLLPLKPLAAFGWSGVGLFLVLSGFSIHFRWAASDIPHHRFTRSAFFRRRFFRLYPTYLAAVIATILLTLALGTSLTKPIPWGFAHGNVPGWFEIIDQIAVVPASLVAVAFVGVAWSLGLEIQLYVFYSFLITRLRRIGIVRIVLGTLIVALLYRLLSELVTPSMPAGQFFPGGGSTGLSRVFFSQLPSRAFEWFLGVLAAEAYFGRVRIPRWTQSPIVAAGLIFLAAAIYRFPVGATSLNGHFFRGSDIVLDPLVGLGYFVLLQALVTREGRLHARATAHALIRALAFVGLFSYSLYLLHPVLLEVSTRLFDGVGIGGVAETFLIFAFVLTVAWGFSRLIERPFITGAGDRWILDLMSRLRKHTPGSQRSGTGYVPYSNPLTDEARALAEAESSA